MFARPSRTSAAIVLGAMASLVVPVPPAAAQESEIIVRGLPEGTKMERVSHRDLNLRFIAHLNILNERVDRAVRHVCEERQPLETMSESYRNCANAAWGSARPQIHAAYLQANQLAGR